MNTQTLYRLALTRIPGIGPAYTKKLIMHFGDVRSIFRATRQALIRTGLSPHTIQALLLPPDQAALQRECDALEQQGIRILCCTDPDYPQRLQHFSDAPPLLFYKGNANLNAGKVLAVIGTRNASDYGREITRQIIRDLVQPDLLIISGLALGIDATAHTAALHHHIPTVGVLGHGLSHIYPAEHRGLSRAMCRQGGGLLTPFDYDAGVQKHNFPIRNHLVAGMCDAIVLVETRMTGGSLQTVDTARTRQKKVFAVPGRLTDPRSAGCLDLIDKGQARLLVSASQLSDALGWNRPSGQPCGQHAIQSSLTFPATNGPEDRILSMLREKDSLPIDELATVCHLDAPSLAFTLLQLELEGKVLPLPGKRYRLNH